MIRKIGLVRAAAFAVALLAVAPSTARAQDLVNELTARLGTSVDLRTEYKLRQQLADAGLISKTAFTVRVTPDLVTKAIGVKKFYNHVNETRYHVGDRIMIENKGASNSGRYSARAEISEVLPDGKYKVKVWDKPVTENVRAIWGHVDALTGQPPANSSSFKIKVTKPDGSVVEETSRTPWLVRSNEREVVMTHEEVDRLNGRVESNGNAYSVNGWRIDPASDPVLAERIEKAKATVERLMPSDKLVLPDDPAARRAKLEEIAKLQEKVLAEIFADNFIEHPGNNARANDRMRDVLKARPELSGKIGAVLESKCGVCTDQAAAMVSILNVVGERMGLTARAIGGATIKERAGHGFVALRFADGKMGMYDVTWHFQGDRTPVDNMDFATWEGVSDSNRNIDYVSQETTDKTAFVERKSDKARESYRGYTKAEGEAILAARARELAETKNLPIDKAAERVLEENRTNASDKIAGDFTPASVAARAKTMKFTAPETVGLTGKIMDKIKDRLHGDKDRVR